MTQPVNFNQHFSGNIGNLSQGNQGGTTQTANFGSADIHRVLQQARVNIDDLSPEDREKASHQLDVIEAELASAKPDDGVIRQAGQSLKQIAEGALAGAAANALSNPAVWTTIADQLGRMFG